MVVMVHGSGALDFDETVFKNKPFRDIAEGLSGFGVSTLRYHKRNFVYPEPLHYMEDETILDALSAIKLAHRYSNNVYLLGHSLGAMLAPIIAHTITKQNHSTDSLQIKGIIMMAAPARDLEEVVREQMDYLLPSGASDSFKQQQIDNIRQRSPHYFQSYHQVEVAKDVSLPILILQGERDYQVSMSDFNLWKKALENHQNASFHSYPSLNHLFMTGNGKSNPLEYQIESRVSDETIKDIADFIIRNK